MERIILEDIKNDSIQNPESVFIDTIIDLDEVIERPPLAISIGYDDHSYAGVHYPLKFGSLGNISMITGEEKSRKSFVKSLIESCTIGGNSNNYTGDLEVRGHIDGKYIISIDSEQSKYDVWMNGNRIKKMVGNVPDTYKILMWREKTTAERLQLLDWLFMESPFKDNLGLVMLDGYVDFVNDFNSQTESKDFTAKLMKYSSLRNCHISGILHLNPNSDKARGHLGTILGQKAECVMVVKNEGEYSSVRCKVVRGSKPFKEFTIRIDNDWMPYISEGDTEQIPGL
tara:strand:- start:971 stop:1825 length:855 start_codon:yes stop_codon:yes gene_type:complete